MQADVYACTSADAWVLVRVIDASWCTCMHKYNAYACTSAAVWSGWCRLMYMHARALLFENWRVWLMQVNVYAYKRTAVWPLARVVDASWCIRMHKCGCLSASESDWCKLMYMHAQVQCIRIHKYSWFYYHNAFVCMCLRVINTDSRTYSTLAQLVMFFYAGRV